MSKFDIAHLHASISKHGTLASSLSDALLLQFRMKNISLALRDYCYGIVSVAKNVMAGISGQSSVSSLQSSSAVSVAPMHSTVASL